MRHITGESLLESLNWRYAVKKFDPTKKIAQSDWNTLAETLRLSPSSYGLQPWKFLIVQNPELRKRLTPVSWGQSQIEDASHLVVMATLKTLTEPYVDKYIQDMAQTRGLHAADLQGFKVRQDLGLGEQRVRNGRSRGIGLPRYGRSVAAC